MFCRNCGKEIGNSPICPYCNERDEENSKKNGIDFDGDGQFITSEGKVAFKTPQDAVKAYQKTARAQITVQSAFSVLSVFSFMLGVISFFAGGVFSSFSHFVSEFNSLSIVCSLLTYATMTLTQYLSIPCIIMHFVFSGKMPKWIKINNIDCDATIGNKRDQYAYAIKGAQLKSNDAKLRRKEIAASGISIIFFSLISTIIGGILACANFGFLMFAQYLSTLPYSFKTEPILWYYIYIIVFAIIITVMLLICFIPPLLSSVAMKQRVKKEFEKEQ